MAVKEPGNNPSKENHTEQGITFEEAGKQAEREITKGLSTRSRLILGAIILIVPSVTPFAPDLFKWVGNLFAPTRSRLIFDGYVRSAADTHANMVVAVLTKENDTLAIGECDETGHFSFNLSGDAEPSRITVTGYDCSGTVSVNKEVIVQRSIELHCR